VIRKLFLLSWLILTFLLLRWLYGATALNELLRVLLFRALFYIIFVLEDSLLLHCLLLSHCLNVVLVLDLSGAIVGSVL
jgi:hypothetical protein